MITPKFSLVQSDNDLTITIHATYAKVSDVEIDVNKNVFIFYSSPYYLRLTFPGDLIDSESTSHGPKATFDADQGAFIIVCKKENSGEIFNGLDMLTKLLTPKGAEGISKPLIEVLNNSQNDYSPDLEDGDFDFLMEQTIPEDNFFEGYKYGFANSHSGVFTALRDELTGVVDILNPDSKPLSVRREERIEAEKDHFDDDHYLADFFENETTSAYLEFKPALYTLKKNEVKYSNEDEESLLKLPRKELLVDSECRLPAFTGLFDLIYAWCYDHRITLGENCSESAWNIKKISPSLSWLDSFTSLKEVAIGCMRRSLIFPLTRNWEMSKAVLKDTQTVFSLGKKQVLICLLEILRLFNGYEPYYLLNQMFITDYCIWIQSIKEERISNLADSIAKLKISKDDMDLDLVKLEDAAKLVMAEEKSVEERTNLNNLVSSMDQLSVIQNNFALSANDNCPDPVGSNAPVAPVCYILPTSTSSSDSSSSDDSSSDSDDNSSSDDSSSEESD